MRIIAVSCAALAIILSGLGLVGLAAPELRRTPGGRVLGWTMALLLGAALWSGVYSVSLFSSLCDPHSRLAKDVGLALLGGLALAWSARPSRTASGQMTMTGEEFRTASGRPQLILVSLLVLAMPMAALIFLETQANNPDGSWDAWAIWNMRARFLTRAGADYAVGLRESISIPHADYPLLLPGLVAQWWLVLGAESVTVPAMIAAVFTASTVAMPAIALTLLRSRAIGITAALILLGIPFLMIAGASQCADIVVAAYIAATSIAVTFGLEGPHRRNDAWFALAGLACSSAAFTKNEGQLFLVSFAAALILRPPSTAERAPRLATVAWFLLGAAPLTILGFYMKYRFDLHNDIFSGQDPSDIIFNKLLKLSRYKFIFKSFIYEPLTWTKWGLAPVALPVLVMGFSRGNLQRSAVPVLCAALGLAALGFFAIYLITPHDLQWHVTSSMDRLLLQCVPSAVFTSLLTIGSRSSQPQR